MKGPRQAARTHAPTHIHPHTHARFLCAGCGKRGSLSQRGLGLGHPLRCLAVASCGSGAAKRLRNRSARSARVAKVNSIVESLAIRGANNGLQCSGRLLSATSGRAAKIKLPLPSATCARTRGTLKSDSAKEKTGRHQNKAGGSGVRSGAAM